MTTRESLDIIFFHIKKEPVVTATGYISRASQAVKDRPENFYVIGSMGMVSSLAMGIALSKPARKVIALDGDGAVLMNMGALATVGALKPRNFFHIVIDNESYESTGGQPSHTQTIRLEAIAKASGYAFAGRAVTKAELQKAMQNFLEKKGPAFLLVKTQNDAGVPPPRIRRSPEQIASDFSRCLAQKKVSAPAGSF